MPNQTDEGFWVDLGDVAGQFQEAMWTTEGAVVREYPQMRDAETQTEAPTHRGVTVQADDLGIIPGENPQAGTPPDSPTGATAGSRTRPNGRSWRQGDGCWNCGSGDHSYTRCPSPRVRSFCYGCGLRDTTVRTCPRCGPHYLRATPYTAPRGPRDVPPLPREQEGCYRRAREPNPEWEWNHPVRGSVHHGLGG